MKLSFMIAELLADNPSVGGFDADAYEETYDEHFYLDKLRERQGQIGDDWGDDATCKACVHKLKEHAATIDRAASRQDWIASNPEAYAAEQQLLSSEGKPVE